MFTLNCKGKLLQFDEPIVMGIINITPDSFYQGQLHEPHPQLLVKVEQMLKDGAQIIDIGGQSTRPDSVRISSEEETERVIPIIQKIIAAFPDIILSIDTYYSAVAKEAISAGASMINDISAGNADAEMLPLVASSQVPYIAMHMNGTPENMHQHSMDEHATSSVLDFFIHKINECKKAGIKDIIIDPGFGFGKTIEQNYTLLKNLAVFNMLDYPILAGLSRKSMIYKTLDIKASDALNGTSVLNSFALMNGANILRVHDVKEATEAIKLFSTYKNAALQENGI